MPIKRMVAIAPEPPREPNRSEPSP
jgi:hypothetical protein